MHQTGSNDTFRGHALLRATAAATALGGATRWLAAAAVGQVDPAAAGDVDAVVAVGMLGVGAAAAGVLAVGCALLALGAAGRATGRSWRLVDGAARRLTPVALRRLVVLGVGVGLSSTALPAIADEAAPELGWQVTETAAGTAQPDPVVAEQGAAEPITTEPITTEPITTEPITVPVAIATTTDPQPATVVVRAGDCLWTIAGDHLPDGAGPGSIAAAWPAWYAANRATIGADPDLILPGQVLAVPEAAS